MSNEASGKPEKTIKKTTPAKQSKTPARTVPGVHMAVKWNSPLYGMEAQHWFLGTHCFAKYIKLAFFHGTSLTPAPPVDSKNAETRYFHIYENEGLLEDWVRQASRLPGERM